MLASRRTWWRIAKHCRFGQFRPAAPTRRSIRVSRPKPVVAATRPGQAWSWDITDLHTPWRGVVWKAYKITDIFSREIVGWRVEAREADHLAVEMFQTAIIHHGIPDIVHADSGPSMRSNLLATFLGEYGVKLSHNRAYVSNDNPFSEAGFKTMKYRPGYPGTFDTLEHARAYLAEYVGWYNTEHKHSGIALFSPAQVGDGSWKQAWEARDRVFQAYYLEHPERFRKVPVTPAPAGLVGINLPDQVLP